MVIVIKLGGDLIQQSHPTLFPDLRRTASHHQVVIVHGGGDEVTRIAERLGKKQQFIVSPGGIRSRYTDKETVDIYTMVMCGKNNKEIVSSLFREGLPAVGLSGLDGGILRAARKKKLVVQDNGRRRIVEGGYTGQIKSVNIKLLDALLESGFVPVIAPVALGEQFEFLNADADRAAANVAGNMKADEMILLTDVPGIYLNDTLVLRMNLQEAKKALAKMGHGMEKKLMSCIEALEMGVPKTIIASGRVGNPITRASNENGCTVISNE